MRAMYVYCTLYLGHPALIQNPSQRQLTAKIDMPNVESNVESNVPEPRYGGLGYGEEYMKQCLDSIDNFFHLRDAFSASSISGATTSTVRMTGVHPYKSFSDAAASRAFVRPSTLLHPGWRAGSERSSSQRPQGLPRSRSLQDLRQGHNSQDLWVQAAVAEHCGAGSACDMRDIVMNNKIIPGNSMSEEVSQSAFCTRCESSFGRFPETLTAPGHQYPLDLQMSWEPTRSSSAPPMAMLEQGFGEPNGFPGSSTQETRNPVHSETFFPPVICMTKGC